MKTQLTACIYIDHIRTKTTLIEVASKQVIETIISQSENNSIEKFLNLLAQILELLQKKNLFLEKTVCEIQIFLPAIFSNAENDAIAVEFTDHILLKNIIEQRFLFPCKIFFQNTA